MSEKYILAIDQSTQGTKALLFDAEGKLAGRADQPHRQLINDKGWVSHDPEEIFANVLQAVKDVVRKTGIEKVQIQAVGISNQRETAMIWDKRTGKPIGQAIVWQCARGEAICQQLAEKNADAQIQAATGLPLSPYFSAAKIAWLLRQHEEAVPLMQDGLLGIGTMDSWLIYKLTQHKVYKTDYSNASRTQLFNIKRLCWDTEICQLFGILPEALPVVCDSNACFGTTNFSGWLDSDIPIQAVMGDSHGALFGQCCHQPGMLKATYGTGSSVMMNTGNQPIFSTKGLATSLAWCLDGKVSYVLEGNINYTGAVISWLKDQMHLLVSSEESAKLAKNSNQFDKSYFVPAFSGLGAPYWDSEATAIFTGITRNTGKNEFVRAGLDAIAYQIADIVQLMREESKMQVKSLRADGGPTRNDYLMQFQSDILQNQVMVSAVAELSALGVAYAAGLAAGLYRPESLFENISFYEYRPQMKAAEQMEKYKGWQQAVEQTRSYHERRI